MTTNKDQRLRAYVRRIMRRSVTPRAEGLESLEVLGTDYELVGGDADGLEAIVHREQRPALDIRDDRYGDVPYEWREQLEAARECLSPLIRAVGRVQSQRPYSLYDGTAFVVGPGVLMTNRHVAELFIHEVGTAELRFEPFHITTVDLKVERGHAERFVLEVRGAKLVHPYWDMALLEVSGLPDDLEPLVLRARAFAPDELPNRPVAVVGYPYFDPRNEDAALQNRIFQGEYGVKRLMPGYTGAPAKKISYGRSVDVLTHDASTLGGNSGSAVIDLASREVIGLHFAGEYLVDNYAVPSWELAADTRVRKPYVCFGSGDLAQERDEVVAAWSAIDDAAPIVPEAIVSRARAEGLPPDFLSFMDEAALADVLQRDPIGTRTRLVEVLGVEEADELVDDLSGSHTEALERVDPGLPEIVWMHGIMGGHLDRVGSRRVHIWLSAASLLGRPIADLLRLDEDGSSDARPGGSTVPNGYLNLYYARAARRWRRAGFAVHEFSYDWRKGIENGADRLHHFIETLRLDRPRRRLALVAHSMGGLVCAAYAARHPEWSDVITHAAFMGTPLRGSFAPVEAMTGVYPFLRKLAAVAARANLDDLMAMSCTLPGLIDMLPDPALFDAELAYDGSAWSGHKPLQRWLDQSRAMKPRILASPLLERTTCFVSLGHATVGSLAAGGVVRAGPANVAGDGTVPGRSCVVPNVPAFKVKREHAAIPHDRLAIDGVTDLLRGANVQLQPATSTEASATFAQPEAAASFVSPEAYAEVRARMQREVRLADLEWLLCRELAPPKEIVAPRDRELPPVELESATQSELEIRVYCEFRRVPDGVAAGVKDGTIRGWNRGTTPLSVKNATIAIGPAGGRVAPTNKKGIVRFPALPDGTWTLRLDPDADELSPGPAIPDAARDHGLDWNKGNITRHRARGKSRSFEVEYRPLELAIEVVGGAISGVVITSPKAQDRPHHAVCFWRGGVVAGAPSVKQVLEIDLKADFLRLLDAGGAGVHPPARKRATQPGIRLFQIHHTAGNLIGPAINQFIGASNGIHFINDRDGHVVRMTDDRYHVVHGGGAKGLVENAWADLPKINEQAIGVENVHKAPAEFTSAQLTSLVGLVRKARETYPVIALNHVVGHCDVFTGKLECPGGLFPWEELEAAGAALGPSTLSDGELDAGWGGFFAGAVGKPRVLQLGDRDRREPDGTFTVVRNGKMLASGLALGPVALLNDCLHALGYTPNRSGKKVASFVTWKAKNLAKFGPGTRVAIKFFKAHYCRGGRAAESSQPVVDHHVARLVLGCHRSLTSV